MEQIQTAEIKSPVSKGVRAQQIAAAVLMVMSYMIELFSQVPQWLDIEIMLIKNIVEIVLTVVSLAILVTIASDRISRNLSNVLLASQLILSIPLLLLCSEKIDFKTYSNVFLPFAPFVYLLIVYFYSVLLGKMQTGGETRVAWLSILPLFWIVAFMQVLGNGIMYWSDVGINLSMPRHSILSRIIWPGIIFTLTSIAYYRLCTSTSFQGNYDNSPLPRGCWSPFNRYMLALVVTAVIVPSLYYLFYRYVAPVI